MKALKILTYIFLLFIVSLFVTYNILFILSLEDPITYEVIANINFDGEIKDISFNKLTQSEDKTLFIVKNMNNYKVLLNYEKTGELAPYLLIDRIHTLEANEEKQTFLNINIGNIEELDGKTLTGNITIHMKRQLFWFFY